MTTTLSTGADLDEVRAGIRSMYREVARRAAQAFHFPTGRALAERLGYPAEWLDAVPAEALASFAGVGSVLDLAALQPGERVLDLGSGSGTDAFIAAHLVGPGGAVTGVDMTEEQLAKARAAAARAEVRHLSFREGLVEEPPVEDACADAVISNGVVNLVLDKARLFRAAAAALRPGGRLAIADVVTAQPIRPGTRERGELWAACIAGAVPLDEELAAIEAAGLTVETVRLNPEYRFVSPRAVAAAERYGAVSVSIRAIR